MTQRPAVHYGVPFALSLLTFAASYEPFVRLLIRYQSWRLGHPNPFALGPAADAVWCSLLAAAIVFWVVVRRAKRQLTGGTP